MPRRRARRNDGGLLNARRPSICHSERREESQTSNLLQSFEIPRRYARRNDGSFFRHKGNLQTVIPSVERSLKLTIFYRRLKFLAAARLGMTVFYFGMQSSLR